MISAQLAQTATPQFGNMTSSFADSTGLFPIAAVVIVIGLVIVGLISSARFYRAVLNASGAFARSFEYAIKGVATAAVIAVFVGPLYLFSQLDGQSRSVVYQAIGALVAGYVGLVVLGYVGDSIWSRIRDRHEEVTGEQPFAGGD